MKITLLLAALIGFTAVASAADKKTDKPERKSRTEKKDDKKDDKKEVRNEFAVTIEGAKDDAAVSDVKTWLASIEGVRVEKAEKTDKGVEAILSTATKISRSDIGKAIKENKDLKVSDFKAVRPGREKDEKKDDKKTDDKKADDKKADEKKMDEKKTEEKKTTETKPDEKK